VTLDSGRLEAFSDGVFAVAITLLALNLAVPGPGHGPLAGQLAGHWPSFAAYVVSFLTIGIIWVNHHALFKDFAKIDRTVLFLNLLMLFFVVAIPFATATIAAYLSRGGADASLAAAVYQGVFEGMALSFGVLFWWSTRHDHLKIALTPAAAHSAIIRFGTGNAGYLAAIGIAFVNAPASLLVSGLVAAYYVFGHTPARTGGAQPGPGHPRLSPGADGGRRPLRDSRARCEQHA
jgi:TMEM175 potassium channel family protein